MTEFCLYRLAGRRADTNQWEQLLSHRRAAIFTKYQIAEQALADIRKNPDRLLVYTAFRIDRTEVDWKEASE